ncbi:hypothetical protein LCGC14_2996980, partial [marine sediment metagenome]
MNLAPSAVPVPAPTWPGAWPRLPQDCSHSACLISSKRSPSILPAPLDQFHLRTLHDEDLHAV